MGYVDRTTAFREQVTELARIYPPPSNQRKGKARQDVRAKSNDAPDGFLTEAYAILGHINTLSNLLSRIRRPYLNVDSPTKFRGEISRNLDMAGSDHWSNSKSMTNDERDQIDLQARVILGQCAERVSKLEQLEKAKIARAQNTSIKANPLLKFLPSLLPTTASAAHAELIAAHRSNITWYLTRRLADVGASQKELQEERVKRQLDRARTLGGSSNTHGVGLGGSLSNSWSSFQIVPPPVTTAGAAALESYLDDDEDDIELTESQIVQFEQENAAILRQQEDLLSSVHQAESRLLDISSLQTELVMQLARQTEMVDVLYDEAIASQVNVEQGNEQLRRARERAKNSRKWILLFILLATLALLFLHWYD